jgi:hypothetical protein
LNRWYVHVSRLYSMSTLITIVLFVRLFVWSVVKGDFGESRVPR